MTAQWNLGAWHLVRHCEKNPKNGRLWFNDYPYGILAAETYMILAALDLMGSHKAAEDGFDQWVSLPMDPRLRTGHHDWALPDRPNGLFSEGHGCLTHAVGPPGAGGHMDGVHAFGPGSIGWALIEHYRLTGDKAWFKATAPRIKANAEWMLRQRRVVQNMVPGGERLWCKGLQPALQVTPDSGGLWMQFYECEAYYWARGRALRRCAGDDRSGRRRPTQGRGRGVSPGPAGGGRAVHRAVAGGSGARRHVPFGHSVRLLRARAEHRRLGLAARWLRRARRPAVLGDGPVGGGADQSGGLLSPDDVRVQGYLDVLEDRLLLENTYVQEHAKRDWFAAGWQYQGGLERTANMHLAGDDIPVFLRSFLNCYAIDILPNDGYIFNEHAVHGPPDKIFEEAAFLERFRNMLVMEDGETLWLARATPRAWLEQGKKITVKNAPTHFGTVAYEIVSDVDNGKIDATVEMPSRNSAQVRAAAPPPSQVRADQER